MKLTFFTQPECTLCDAAWFVVEKVARAHDALGWKVNGAGGEGGSLSILFGPEGELKRSFIKALADVNPKFQVIPTYLSRMGLRRWEAAV